MHDQRIKSSVKRWIGALADMSHTFGWLRCLHPMVPALLDTPPLQTEKERDDLVNVSRET